MLSELRFFHSPVCIKASWTLAHAKASAFLWNDLDVEPITETQSTVSNIQYKKLNVATLRTLVVEKELATKAEAAKINKKDLTTMLENNN